MWDWSEDQIKMLWIRHGATAANREHRYLGQTEEALSVEGIRSLKERKRAGYYPKMDKVVCSPMKRCLETAQILYPDQPPIIIPEWSEMDFGDFEGKTYLELQSDARYQAWIDSGGTLPFPNGESREAYIRRCLRGWERMRQLLFPCLEQEEKTVAAVVHGGTIMALFSTFYGGDYFDYQVENGAGYFGIFRGISVGSGVGRPTLAVPSRPADRWSDREA